VDSSILVSDPITRIQTIFHPDADGDKYVIEEKQDAEDIVEANRHLYNQFDERANWKGDMHRVASIPLSVFMGAYKRGLFRGAKLSKEDSAFLNDPDNRAFRTRPGRV
jgi:hypothetical protein